MKNNRNFFQRATTMNKERGVGTIKKRIPNEGKLRLEELSVKSFSPLAKLQIQGGGQDPAGSCNQHYPCNHECNCPP